MQRCIFLNVCLYFFKIYSWVSNKIHTEFLTSFFNVFFLDIHFSNVKPKSVPGRVYRYIVFEPAPRFATVSRILPWLENPKLKNNFFKSAINLNFKQSKSSSTNFYVFLRLQNICWTTGTSWSYPDSSLLTSIRIRNTGYIYNIQFVALQLTCSVPVHLSHQPLDLGQCAVPTTSAFVPIFL